nr:helix-turn-helix domain-containing protein [Prevotella sp.]
AHEVSADYHAELIVMSSDFQEDRKQDSTDAYRDNFHYLTQPHISLTDEQFDVIHQLFGLVRTISQTASATRDEKMTNLLNTIFLLLQDYRRENGIREHEPSPHEQIFTQFYQAITQHYAQNREVRFYANLFHLSPKYFATIIKQHTKTNALEWINGYVMVQAKILLRYKQQLTIQEIALKLGFADQAAFSRFFKSHSGMSPTEYRDLM